MRTSVAAALAALGSTAYAAIQKQCPTSNVCFSLNVPDDTSSSGNGDIYFQMSAPTSLQYASVGQGSSMSGSNIFVMYTSSDGNNVTLSPRLGTGHDMPEFNSDAQVTLLDGSGVSNGIMTANVKCSNCQSWSGGSMDFTGSGNVGWIWATKSGSALNSDDTSATIQQHGSEGGFNFNLASAKGGSDVNPFTSATQTTAGSGSSVSCTPKSSATAASDSSGGTATSAGSASTTVATYPWGTGAPPSGIPTGGPFKRDDNSCDDGGDSSSSYTGAGSYGAAMEKTNRMLIAHGVLACLAFAVLFPFGAIGIRLFSFPGLIWVHAAFQMFAYVVYIIAFGLGIYLATEFRYMTEYHPIIGIVLFIVLFAQPVLGWLHHALFKKYGFRTFWSYAHLWVGRLAITLGIINGGLGFLLARNSPKGQIAYGVIAAIIWVVYIISIFIGEKKRNRNMANMPPKYADAVSSRNASPPRGRGMEDINAVPPPQRGPREFYGKP